MDGGILLFTNTPQSHTRVVLQSPQKIKRVRTRNFKKNISTKYQVLC